MSTTMRDRLILLSALILSLLLAANVSASGCTPPPGFADTPHPPVTPRQELVSHTEETVIDAPLAAAVAAIDRPLQDTIRNGGSLPSVAGTHALTQGGFGAPGSRRLVCLTDGSTLEEQVLDRDLTATSFRFRYVVWNYTTSQARPIEYGVGEFLLGAAAADRTHLTWTYSFRLRSDRFPGYLGGLGRWLFRIGFLDRQYAGLMRNTLQGMRQTAEARQ